MLRTHTCVTAECDRCGATCHDDEYQPHWPTEAQALTDLVKAGWQTIGSRLVCRHCAAVLACHTSGHDLSSWNACPCQQRIFPYHPVDQDGSCAVRYRVCDRCGHFEQRPAPGA